MNDRLPSEAVANLVVERALVAMKDRGVPWNTACDRLITLAAAEMLLQVGPVTVAELLRTAADAIEAGELSTGPADPAKAN